MCCYNIDNNQYVMHHSLLNSPNAHVRKNINNSRTVAVNIDNEMTGTPALPLYSQLICLKCASDFQYYFVLLYFDYAHAIVLFVLRPCSHHSFGTGTVPERNRAPVFTPVPLRPVVPERADHLAM